jgi:hypothetical protein
MNLSNNHSLYLICVRVYDRRVKISLTALAALVETNHGDERLTYYEEYVAASVKATMTATHETIRIQSCSLVHSTYHSIYRR